MIAATKYAMGSATCIVWRSNMTQRNCGHCLKPLDKKYPNRKYCDNNNVCKQAEFRLVKDYIAHIKDCNLCKVRIGYHVSQLRRKTSQLELEMKDLEEDLLESWLNDDRARILSVLRIRSKMAWRVETQNGINSTGLRTWQPPKPLPLDQVECNLSLCIQAGCTTVIQIELVELNVGYGEIRYGFCGHSHLREWVMQDLWFRSLAIKDITKNARVSWFPGSALTTNAFATATRFSRTHESLLRALSGAIRGSQDCA